MNTLNLYLTVLSLSFLLSACGSKRIDTSSDERMKKSIEEVRAFLQQIAQNSTNH